MIQNICREQSVNILYQLSLFIKQSGEVEIYNPTPSSPYPTWPGNQASGQKGGRGQGGVLGDVSPRPPLHPSHHQQGLPRHGGERSPAQGGLPKASDGCLQAASKPPGELGDIPFMNTHKMQEVKS